MCRQWSLKSLSNGNLGEIEARISPTKCANFELSHAADVEIHFIIVMAETINILEIYAMVFFRVDVNRITPLRTLKARGGVWNGKIIKKCR